VTTTGDFDPDINTLVLVDAEEENRLIELRTEDLGGEELERCAVHLNETLALHTARDGCNSKIVSKSIVAQSMGLESREYIPVAFFFLPKTWTA